MREHPLYAKNGRKAIKHWESEGRPNIKKGWGADSAVLTKFKVFNLLTLLKRGF